MSSGEVETTRETVKTYVPAYQKERWRAHAADLDMSLSEFVRTMVQSGRRDVDLDAEETDSGGAPPSGERLEARILDVLEGGPQSYDELLGTVTADIEDRVAAVLGDLQSENRIQHSGPDGGYRLVGDGDE